MVNRTFKKVKILSSDDSIADTSFFAGLQEIMHGRQLNFF